MQYWRFLCAQLLPRALTTFAPPITCCTRAQPLLWTLCLLVFNLQANYQNLMDTFPECSDGSSTFESVSAHQLRQVLPTVVRNLLQASRRGRNIRRFYFVLSFCFCEGFLYSIAAVVLGTCIAVLGYARRPCTVGASEYVLGAS